MKTKAVRLYDKNDLRLEEFDLPEMRDDEILAEVVTDSLCMSTFKAVSQGAQHSKVPDNIKKHPIIVGHEFCGNILAAGKKWENEFKPGDKFVIQPNIGDKKLRAPGYSFRFIGGDATRIIIPNQVMENGSLLKYSGKTYFEGSLVEPLSCVVGAFNANYHMKQMYSYEHVMGIKENSSMVLMAATGPMGLLAIDLALHGPKKPKVLVVTGHTQDKLDWTEKLYNEEEAKKSGVELHYINTDKTENYVSDLIALTEGRGFDDVFIFAPKANLAQEAGTLLGYDGCLNFFAGPSDHNLSAPLNFYNVHYKAAHVVGTSGGNTEDMKESISLIEAGAIKVGKIVSHILGLNDVPSTSVALPKLPGNKKLVYTQKRFALTSLTDFDLSDDLSSNLADIVGKNNGFWNLEAEQYFLEHAPAI